MLNHPLNNLNDSITHVLVSLCIFLYKGCFAEELSICSRTLKYCTTEGFCGAQRPKIETFVILLLLSVLLNENFQSVPEHQNGAEWRNLGVLEVKILKFSWGFAPNPIGGAYSAPPNPPAVIFAPTALTHDRLRRSLTRFARPWTSFSDHQDFQIIFSFPGLYSAILNIMIAWTIMHDLSMV